MTNTVSPLDAPITAMPTSPRPAFDPELAAVLPDINAALPPALTPDMIEPVRAVLVAMAKPLAEIVGDRPIDVQDYVIPGPPDAPELTVTVLRPRGRQPAAPAIYGIHGGGLVLGNRLTGIEQLCDWVTELGAVVVTPEYRLAPEHPDPAPIEDSYAGLVWTAGAADELGIDPTRLVVAGASAGGGLAAGLALLARDRGGPALAGQVLIYPMLDDRNDSFSAGQFAGLGVWDQTSNATAWGAVLGARRGTDAVSQYAAPARAADLSRLPPAFLDVCSTETFRDEAVAYAGALWRAGVQAELHVWPGGFHSSDSLVPTAELSLLARRARVDWLRRLFAGSVAR